MSERFDLIAVGETMLSLIAEDGTLETATTFRASHGGAESNSCVGASRAGLRTAWVSRLGSDPAGDRVLEALGSEGVDLRWVARDPARPTGLMVRDTSGGVRYWRSGSAASALQPSDLASVPIEEARAVLVTGITAIIGAGPQQCAVALLERARGLRAVDLNLRPGLWGSDRAAELIRPLVERADMLFGGADELTQVDGPTTIPGLRKGGPGIVPSPQEMARACARLGPREVVVTFGAAGAGALAPDGHWHEHRPVPGSEIDPVGAGDAFDAAYLVARLAGGPVPDALEAGAAAGARIAGTFGDTGPVRAAEDVTR